MKVLNGMFEGRFGDEIANVLIEGRFECGVLNVHAIGMYPFPPGFKNKRIGHAIGMERICFLRLYYHEKKPILEH